MKAILIDAKLFLNGGPVSIHDLVREVVVKTNNFSTFYPHLQCSIVQPVCKLPKSADWIFVDEEGLLKTWPIVKVATPWYYSPLAGNVLIARQGRTDVSTTVEDVKSLILNGTLSFAIVTAGDMPHTTIIV